MGHLLAFICFLFSLSAHAGVVPGGFPSFGVGQGVSSNPTAWFSVTNAATTGNSFVPIDLAGYVGSAAAGDFYPLFGPPGAGVGDAGQYRVSAGKTLYCVAGDALSSGASNNFQLVSATAPFAGGVSSITGPYYQCGATQAYCDIVGATVAVPTPFEGSQTRFSSLTYPGFQSNGNGNQYSIHLTCFEN